MIYIIGLCSGILSGLAIGGGTLLVPALVILLAIEQHTAQGICLTAFIPTALVAIITHSKQGNVKYKLVLSLILWSILGAFIGATLAHWLDGSLLKKAFGFFLIFMGVYEYK